MQKAATALRAFLFCLPMLLWSCKKGPDSGNPAASGTLPDFTTTVAASASGFVTNENNQPVSGASVKMGSSATTTDSTGYFSFSNIQVVKEAATVVVKVNGYFPGIKTFFAHATQPAFLRIKLLRKIIAGTVSATVGGEVNLSNGVRISFPANAIKNATTGAAYSGTVSVAAQWIDPTSPELNNIMPGDLRAVNAAGFINRLTTYGMTAVELTGGAGELLQIAGGKKAAINFPIPATLLSKAPASLPLWYFDESKGLWIEEGTATKSGNSYAGSVSHFSFWNCDVGSQYIIFDATITNNAGLPVSNALVKIYPAANPNDGHFGYTNNAGYVSGAVPPSTQLVLEVLSDSTCSGPLFSKPFTTSTSNISLGNIALPSGTTAEVSGKVVNCNNTGVTNGSLLVWRQGKFLRFPLVAGDFNISLPVCGSAGSIVLTGQDLGTGMQSAQKPMNLVAGANNAGNLSACVVNLSEFVTTTVNGVTINYTKPPDNIGISQYGTVDEIFASHVPNNNQWARFRFTNSGIGPNTNMSLTIFNSYTIGDPAAAPVSPVTVRITEYGPIGGYIAGNFNGTITNKYNAASPYTVSCSFRVKRWF